MCVFRLERSSTSKADSHQEENRLACFPNTLHRIWAINAGSNEHLRCLHRRCEHRHRHSRRVPKSSRSETFEHADIFLKDQITQLHCQFSSSGIIVPRSWWIYLTNQRCGEGYSIFELPSNLVIRRIVARWWLSFLIISWGACVLGMGFAKSWRTLTTLRAWRFRSWRYYKFLSSLTGRELILRDWKQSFVLLHGRSHHFCIPYYRRSIFQYRNAVWHLTDRSSHICSPQSELATGYTERAGGGSSSSKVS